jgi:hypothetical protein
MHSNLHPAIAAAPTLAVDRHGFDRDLSGIQRQLRCAVVLYFHAMVDMARQHVGAEVHIEFNVRVRDGGLLRVGLA